MFDKSAFESTVSGLSGTVGVYIHDTVSGEVWSHNADSPVIAASVIKLFIMAEAYRQAEAGLFDFAEDVTVPPERCLPSCGAITYLHPGLTLQWGDLVTLMIILSDNTATNLLIDRLGIENINRMIDSLGLKNTRLNRRLFEPELSARGIQNYITAADCGVFLEKLLRGEIVSAEASSSMLRTLSNQRLNGKMPFYLHSEGIRCAHKTGEDDGITHDVGDIYATSPRIQLCQSEHPCPAK